MRRIATPGNPQIRLGYFSHIKLSQWENQGFKNAASTGFTLRCQIFILGTRLKND
jgi:hypothetical protein